MVTNVKVEVVKVGEMVMVKYPSGIKNVLVQTPCDNKTNGQWYCSTCREFFAHNFDKDTHLSEHPRTTHKLAWNCYEHGIEQP